MSRYKKYSNPYSIDVQRYSIYGVPNRKRRGLQLGDEFVTLVEEMDDEGRGISYKHNKKIIIPRAVPGEKVRVRVVKVVGNEVYVAVAERLAEPKR